jgi:pimeloyl-ACP methyl ester carboxylesterase
MRFFALSIVALALAAGPALPGVDDATWEQKVKDFKEDFKKKSVRYKRQAIEGLPTNDERTIKFIIEDQKLLQAKDWWIRGMAAERLARINAPDLRAKLLTYAKHPDWKVREGVIAATGLVKHRLDAPVIVEALSDRAWQVRRMACFAAGQQRIKEAVEKMISMIRWIAPDGRVLQEGELESRVHSVLLFNLEEIVGKYFHTDVDQWKQYWEANKEKTLEPPKRYDVGTFGNVKLDYNDTFARKGTGPLILVLPEVHRTCTYYMPYFNQWMFVRWVFINLPPITSFPGVQYDDGDPVYPVDILVDAFEEMRKKQKVERMGLLAHGFSTWIAAKYAQKYPERVLGLILLNAYCTNETFGKRLDELMRSGDPDDEFFAKVSRRQIKPASPAESDQYDYVRTSAAVFDQSDLEVYFLRKIWVDPNGSTIVIPKFDIRSQNISRVPALLFFEDKANKLTTIDDLNELQKFYVNNFTARLKKSSRLPFMEEPAFFEEALRKFVDQKLDPAFAKAEKTQKTGGSQSSQK